MEPVPAQTTRNVQSGMQHKVEDSHCPGTGPGGVQPWQVKATSACPRRLSERFATKVLGCYDGLYIQEGGVFSFEWFAFWGTSWIVQLYLWHIFQVTLCVYVMLKMVCCNKSATLTLLRLQLRLWGDVALEGSLLQW